MPLILSFEIKIFRNIAIDALLGVAILASLVIFITLILLQKAAKYNKIFAKNVDLITEIRTLPILEKIWHVAEIAETTGNLQTDYLRWRTIYEITYEKKFRQLVNDFYEAANDKKQNKPSRKNTLKLYSIYEELERNVYLINTTLFEDINNFLEPERVYRQFYVRMNNLYLKLLTRIDEKVAIDEFSNEANIAKVKGRVSDAFLTLFNTMADGEWNELRGISDEISNFITHLISLLDIVPTLILENEKLIPATMVELKNKYVTFGQTNSTIEDRARKYADLTREVDTKRITLKNQINGLQYIKGKETLMDIKNLIHIYELGADFEDGIQNKLNIYGDQITDILHSTSSSSMILLKKAKEVMNLKNPIFDFFALQDVVNKVSEVNDDWTVAYESTKNRRPGKKVNFEEVRKKTISSLQKLTEYIAELSNYEDKINKSRIDKTKLIDQVIIVESLINQIEIKIIQFHSVKSLKSFLNRLQGLKETLEKDVKFRLKSISGEESLKILEQELNTIFSSANDISVRVRNEIFYDFMTQELITYLSRFPDDTDGYEKFIESCIIKKSEGKYNDVISSATKVIQQIKTKG